MISFPSGGARIVYPYPQPQFPATPAQYGQLGTSYSIDAAGERLAAIMVLGRSGSITKVGFRTGLVSVQQTLKVEIQTVSLTTGEPTGTLYGGSAKGTVASPASNTYYEVTLGTAASATAGDYIAIVIEFDSTVGDIEIEGARTQASTDNVGYPFVMHRTGGTWSKQTETWPIGHLVFSGTPDIYDSNLMIPVKNCWEISGGGAIGAQMGLKFTLPFKARMIGAYMEYRPRGDNKMVLMKADNTILDTLDNLDSDVWHSTTSHRWAFLPLSAPVILEKGATYRYITENKTTTGQFLYGMQMLNNNILGSYSDKTFIWSYRASGGATAWTDENDRSPYIQLLFDQVDEGVGRDPVFQRKFN